MQHKENSYKNKMKFVSLLLLLTPAVLCCSSGESKIHFLVYFAEGKSNDETNKIAKLLNAIPDDDILVIYPHGAFGASLRLPKEKKCETRVFR